MFESLSERIGGALDTLKKRGALSEADVSAALREVRVALLEADVALPVAKDFIAAVKTRAVGQEVVKSVTPGQQVVKIVHDELANALGGEAAGLELAAEPPAAILMVGLQGAGKTTTAAKLAKRLSDKDKKKVLLASLDTRRPAAMEPLATLATQAGVDCLPIVKDQGPEAIAKRALTAGKLQGYDVVILDSAGRLAIDTALMAELKAVRDKAKPSETLLVADALSGQDAVTTAEAFDREIGVTGVVLTRADGDSRGGAALSMRAATGRPIKFLGMGEKIDALDAFDPQRLAGRILGMGDVVGLVEKAMEEVDQAEAEKLAKKMQKGAFDLDDMRAQLQQMKKMGGMSGLMNLLPGVAKVKAQLANAQVDDKMLARQEAIIGSMTKAERKNPKILNGSRRRRIAAGAGVDVPAVNRLLKQHLQMQQMMKK
ncbi:MAG: signal recognition particle protein, partial [Pseudomonadota bacterium]